MVFSKIRDALSPRNEKYEVLYHKYSKVRLDNKNLREQHSEEMNNYKFDTKLGTARNMIDLYEKIEETKLRSYKVRAVDKEIQNLMVGINQIEKAMRKVMSDLDVEEVTAVEKFFDENLHEVASYVDANGMSVGLVLKTVRKGFRFDGRLIKKPRVVITK